MRLSLVFISLIPVMVRGAKNTESDLGEEKRESTNFQKDFQTQFQQFFSPEAAFKKFFGEGRRMFAISPSQRPGRIPKRSQRPNKSNSESQEYKTNDDDKVEDSLIDKQQTGSKKVNKKNKDERNKNKVEASIAERVFNFYIKAYGCRNTKIYKNFLQAYKMENSNQLIEDPTPNMDVSWLKRLAETKVNEDEDSSVSMEEVQSKIIVLDKNQKNLLLEGDELMPVAARVFIHFIKGLGCNNSNEKLYIRFKNEYNTVIQKAEELRKKNGRKIPVKYYLTKANCIIEEYKIEQ